MDDNNDLFANIDSPPKSAPAAAESRAAPPAPAAAAPVPTAAPRPASPAADGGNYDASAIRVLEGLEPVRMRPGMYIGGTDEKALHHLYAEVIDYAMDEAVAGHANFIEVSLDAEGYLSVTDNG